MELDDLGVFLDDEFYIDDDLDDNIDGDINADNIISEEEKDIVSDKKRIERITAPVMTIYEKVNIISQRVRQLDNNFKTTMEEEVAAKGITKSFDIAMLEFNNRKLPNVQIIRNFPDGSYECWSIDDFEEFP